MRILSLHAHPDDTEFLCAGTLSLLAKRGWPVGIVVCCKGDCGSAEIGPKEIAEIRLHEGRHAAERIGAVYENLGIGDLQLVFDNPTRRLVAEAVRRFAPDVVLAPCPEDYMADHTICCELARDACFTAALPNYDTGVRRGAPVLPHVPALFYCDPVELVDRFGNPVTPAFCVDITSEIEVKAEMLARHDSQRAWLLKHHGLDEYLESMKAWSRARGALVGVEYAEGFRQHLGHAYPRVNPLAEILGDLVRVVSA